MADLSLVDSTALSIGERKVDLGGSAFDDGEEAAFGILLEVRRCSVSIECGLIVVLFVEEEPLRVTRGAMCEVHAATRVGACVRGEVVEERDGVVFVARFDDVGYGDADHAFAPGSLPKKTMDTMHESYRR
jgi:hypothetical protein